MKKEFVKDEHVARILERIKHTPFIANNYFPPVGEAYDIWIPRSEVEKVFFDMPVVNTDKKVWIPPYVWDVLYYGCYSPYEVRNYFCYAVMTQYSVFRLGAEEDPAKDIWCLICCESKGNEAWIEEYFFDRVENKMVLYCYGSVDWLEIENAVKA